MRKYRPDYVSIDEYQKRVKQNKARLALIEAAASSVAAPTPAGESARCVSSRSDEAEFSRALSEAQQAAAALEPKINALCQILQQGEADREKETMPRWQAGYDLAMGRALAVKVRTETYNAMLAAAKRGLKPKDPKNNTWRAGAVRRDQRREPIHEAGRAGEDVSDPRRQGPSGHALGRLAERELEIPLGWKWSDWYTDLTPKDAKAKANPNNARTPRNEQRRCSRMRAADAAAAEAVISAGAR